MAGQGNWNHNQLTFDMNKTTLTVDPYSLTLISSLFPYVQTIKLTLKAKPDPSLYLFERLGTLKNLSKLCLTITDGLIFSSKSSLHIQTLKIYYKTTCAKDQYLKNLLKNVFNVKNLTLCETFIAFNTMAIIRSLPITRLSIKNPHIIRSELTSFINTLSRLDLKGLKLIYTQINDAEAERLMFTVIRNYLKKLPHVYLEELTISIPNQHEDIDYSQIINKLRKLTKLNLYMSTNSNFNNVNQINELLKIIPSYVETTITYYKNERSGEVPLFLGFIE